jgi:hypothetical protein
MLADRHISFMQKEKTECSPGTFTGQGYSVLCAEQPFLKQLLCW